MNKLVVMMKSLLALLLVIFSIPAFTADYGTGKYQNDPVLQAAVNSGYLRPARESDIRNIYNNSSINIANAYVLVRNYTLPEELPPIDLIVPSNRDLPPVAYSAPLPLNLYSKNFCFSEFSPCLRKAHYVLAEPLEKRIVRLATDEDIKKITRLNLEGLGPFLYSGFASADNRWTGSYNRVIVIDRAWEIPSASFTEKDSTVFIVSRGTRLPKGLEKNGAWHYMVYDMNKICAIGPNCVQSVGGKRR